MSVAGSPREVRSACVITASGLDAMIASLRTRGYRVAAPVLREGTVVLEEIETASSLPRGVADVQEPGRWRLEPAVEDALFPVLHGAQTWKRFLLPPRHTLFTASRRGDEIVLDEPEPRLAPWAFLGVRACDVAAIRLQDRILLDGPYPDCVYRRNRLDLFVVAAACERPGETCFCASMGGGPLPGDGCDVVLTELGRGRALAEPGTERGSALLAELPRETASAEERAQAAEQRAAGARAMAASRPFDPAPLVAALAESAESSRWDEIGSRCLSCGNCTMVCPTCFCTTVDDTTDLSGRRAERTRSWDSCFHLDFSYLHGGSVRRSPGARYRQWLTHKLSSWVKQFGTSGCVGCGRCITWCPTGIDLTVEAPAVVAAPKGRSA